MGDLSNTINELTKTISEDKVKEIVNNIQNDYRLSFSERIIEFKKMTNRCQSSCYMNPTKNLLEIEECADKCFSPLFSAHEIIKNLTNKKKSKLEECYSQVNRNYKESESRNYLIEKCIKNYSADIEGIRKEIDFIYIGYIKKLNEIL